MFATRSRVRKHQAGSRWRRCRQAGCHQRAEDSAEDAGSSLAPPVDVAPPPVVPELQMTPASPALPDELAPDTIFPELAALDQLLSS